MGERLLGILIEISVMSITRDAEELKCIFRKLKQDGEFDKVEEQLLD